MVKKKLVYFIFLFTLFISCFCYGNPNLDQWLDSEKTYKDLCQKRCDFGIIFNGLQYWLNNGVYYHSKLDMVWNLNRVDHFEP